jgi:hypothetical protein
MAKVKFYDTEFDFAFNNPSGSPVGRYLSRKGRYIKARARMQAGEKTGQLKRSFSMNHSRSGLGQYVSIKASAPHALVHHEGARPHVIIASPGKSLRFVGNEGQIIFTKKVMHKGHKANKYLTDPLYKYLP